MEEKSQKALMQEAMRIAATAQGKQLLSMLKQANASELSKAMASYQAGNVQEAKRILEEALSSAQGKSTKEQMGK